MEDLTGHSASDPDEFLNNAPASILHSTVTVDETETQGAAESSGEALEDSGDKGSDEIECTSANLGERDSQTPIDEASHDFTSSEQVETAVKDSEMSNQASELVNEATPVESDSNGEGDTTQSHLQSSENDGSINAEVSPTTVVLKDSNVSEGSDSPSEIDITSNAIDSALEPDDEGFEMAKGTGNEDETGNTESRTAREQLAIESLYHIKWIKWKGINTPIITQNENGPCPLLAIVNVLLLQRRINLPSQQTFITSGQLMEYIGDCILEEAPKVCNLHLMDMSL